MALPAVVLVLAVVVAVAQVAVAQVRCVDAARAAVRLAARGEDRGVVVSRAASIAPAGAAVSASRLVRRRGRRPRSGGRRAPSGLADRRRARARSRTPNRLAPEPAVRTRRRPRRGHRARRSGSAPPDWSLAALARVLAVAVVANRRAEAAADLAALAAVTPPGLPPDCARAAAVAAANGARTAACFDLPARHGRGRRRARGRPGAAGGPPFVARARARAGLSPVSGTGSAGEQGVEDGRGPGLVERLVAVAALGRLHAGGAARVAGAVAEHGPGRPQPPRRGPVPAFGEPGAARVRVVDEDRGQARCPGGVLWTGRRRPTGRRSPPAGAVPMAACSAACSGAGHGVRSPSPARAAAPRAGSTTPPSSAASAAGRSSGYSPSTLPLRRSR